MANRTIADPRAVVHDDLDSKPFSRIGRAATVTWLRGRLHDGGDNLARDDA